MSLIDPQPPLEGADLPPDPGIEDPESEEGKTEDKWLDINGASKYTSLSKATLRRSVKSGDLKASNKVGKTMFKQSALESWLS